VPTSPEHARARAAVATGTPSTTCAVDPSTLLPNQETPYLASIRAHGAQRLQHIPLCVMPCRAFTLGTALLRQGEDLKRAGAPASRETPRRACTVTERRAPAAACRAPAATIAAPTRDIGKINVDDDVT
jgi:hypothetical protein